MRSHLCRSNRRPATRSLSEILTCGCLFACLSLRACPHYGFTRRCSGENVSVAADSKHTGLELGSHHSRPGQMFLASLGSPAPNMASGGVSLERRSRCHIRSLLRAPPLSDMMTAQRKPQLDVRGFRLEITEKAR